jgi:hypothetical protein
MKRAMISMGLTRKKGGGRATGIDLYSRAALAEPWSSTKLELFVLIILTDAAGLLCVDLFEEKALYPGGNSVFVPF